MLQFSYAVKEDLKDANQGFGILTLYKRRMAEVFVFKWGFKQ